MTAALPLDTEQLAALKVAKEHGGKLLRGQQTLGLWGPPDFDRERPNLKLLFGDGQVKALVRRGLMAFDPDDARTALVTEGQPS